MYAFGCFLIIVSVAHATTLPNPLGCDGDPYALSLPCGDPCPKTCENKDNPFVSPCQIKCIKNGCKCKDGYVLNEVKKCIPSQSCPVYCKGPNEYYDKCVSGCPEQCLTTDAQRISPCQRNIACQPGCVCLPGFVLNSLKKCIRRDECPPFNCTGTNEEYSQCGDGCPRNCDNTVSGAILYCMGLCVPQCVCKTGFIRNNERKCVEPRLCPKKCVGSNFEYMSCGTPCPKTCDNRHLTINCDKKCVPGCFCKAGYVLSGNGQCVLIEKCPVEKQCNGKNEQFSECDAGNCQNTCANYGKIIRCNPACISGCVCNRYYIRNKDGACVKPTECENSVCPGKNEVYTDCVSSCSETCTTLGQNITCNFSVCKQGCDCKPGFYRNSDNVCVPPNECGCNGDPNAVSLPCGDPCPKTCENKDYPFARPCLKNCIKNGCKCKDGYILNKANKCILTKNCPVYCKDPNQYYAECVPGCPEQCLTTDAVRTFPCLTSIACRPGCTCIPGFVLDLNGKCVPENQCPPFKCTAPNKEYAKCGDACLRTCRNSVGGDFLYCMGLCSPDCVCKKGLVRNEQNKCIESRFCPKQCYGSHFEYKECGTACPETCSNKHLILNCGTKCVPGCFCETGYVLDRSGQCVLRQNCPVEEQCNRQNEEFSDCGANDCQKTCENYGKSVPCTPGCTPGCICNKFFVRNRVGICIKPTRCKNNVCPGKNEVFSECVSQCDKTCATLGKNITCNFSVCNPGCYCKPGFYRNSNNECVPANECSMYCEKNH